MTIVFQRITRISMTHAILLVREQTHAKIERKRLNIFTLPQKFDYRSFKLDLMNVKFSGIINFTRRRVNNNSLSCFLLRTKNEVISFLFMTLTINGFAVN
jgi:hypothetical protein